MKGLIKLRKIPFVTKQDDNKKILAEIHGFIQIIPTDKEEAKVKMLKILLQK